jgi:hypothetical protein
MHVTAMLQPVVTVSWTCYTVLDTSGNHLVEELMPKVCMAKPGVTGLFCVPVMTCHGLFRYLLQDKVVPHPR